MPARRPILSRAVDWLDDRLAAASLTRGREGSALLGFLFHGVFESRREIDSAGLWPSQPLVAGDLARFIEYFLAHGYRFVTPAEIVAGLDPQGHHALLTFDDGYANNQRALPVLHDLSVPATFFISAGHVAECKAFWWDVLFRERRRSGASESAIRREVAMLQREMPEAVDAYVRRAFGADALRPLGDTDRPFGAEELRAFAGDRWVTLGNHASGHLDLTLCDSARRREEIRAGREYLATLTGVSPAAFAYPYGRWDRSVLADAAAEGVALGVTVARHKNRLPLTPGEHLTIARQFVHCDASILAAAARCRSDLGLRQWIG